MRVFLCLRLVAYHMKKKKEDDPHQSSLDSFSNIKLPSMPDLDKLAKADKLIKQKNSLMKEYDELTKTTIQELWKEDLSVFEYEYEKFLKK